MKRFTMSAISFMLAALLTVSQAGAALADVILQCGSSESPLQLGSIPARISQLFMLDILFSEYCRRDYEAARESRSRIAAAISEKHLD